MNKKIYNNLKIRFIELGGSAEVITKLPNFYSLKAEAKLRYEIKKLESQRSLSIDIKENKKLEVKTKEKAVFTDFISQYPVELHPVYLERRQIFLTACSLKIQANSLKSEDVTERGKLQWRIWHLFQKMDKLTEILSYYKEHKRILPQKTKENFSNLSPEQKVQRVRTLRSNRTSRIKTIKRLEKELPEESHPDYLRLLDKLNRKREGIYKINLQIEKLDKIINS